MCIVTPQPPGLPTLEVSLRVNGTEYQLAIEPRVTLLDALREYLGLFGTKKGCDRGECGACTVLLDGRRIDACLTFAVMHHEQEITTVEGLASGEVLEHDVDSPAVAVEPRLHPMQRAFVERDAFQCGYCTPGQIISAISVIREGHVGSEAEIREWMSGNICRCGAYPNIVAAIQDVAASGADV
jgi:xanthine dehydrogenase YagT iron-sulfur-binding subunit